MDGGRARAEVGRAWTDDGRAWEGLGPGWEGDHRAPWERLAAATFRHGAATPATPIFPRILRRSGLAVAFEDLLDADTTLLGALGPYVPRFRFLLDDLSAHSDAVLGRLPAAAVARVGKADAAKLDTWFGRVLTAASLDEVLGATAGRKA